MYDNFKTANYSKALVSPEIYARPLSRLFTGEVIDGFTVVPKTGLTVTLKPGNAFVRYGSTNVASARLVSLVADFDLTHDAKDVSNPRFDLIVVYVDNAVSLPSGTPTNANLDGPGVAKAKIVKGVPNATPVVPNDTSIQARVGAGNPYIVVASDRVDAAVISSDKITDVRVLASANLAPGTVTSAKLSTTAGEIGGAWTTWTYNATGTGSNSTFTGKYMKVGKRVSLWVSISYTGAATGIGNIVFNLPVAASSDAFVGNGLTTISASYLATIYANNNTTQAILRHVFTSGSGITVGAFSATVPQTFASGSSIRGSLTYESV